MASEIVIVDGKVLHLGLAPGQLARNLFLVGDPARALRVAERFDSIDCEVRKREFVTLTGTCNGMPVSVIGTGIGVDNVEIALVEAYTVLAFDFGTGERRADVEPLRVQRIGTSAGCQENIEPGTLAISTYGLGLDNGGLYYDHPATDERVERIEAAARQILRSAAVDGARFAARIEPYASQASPAMVASLAASAAAAGHSHVSGITASTPGFYGASGRYIDGLANTVPSIKTALGELRVDDQIVVNMEMESSLLFHVARRLGCEVGTICPIISKPKSSTAIFDYAQSVENAIDVGLAAMQLIAAGSSSGPSATTERVGS